MQAEPPQPQSRPSTEPSLPAEPISAGEPILARLKWFDATRGFGFLVSDEIDGDILVHFSVLREHGRRALPEGAVCRCIVVRETRGLQASRILSIDLSSAAAPVRLSGRSSASDRADRSALLDGAGPFQPVEVKWFNRVKGYGFLTTADGQGDIFVHMETLREAGLAELQPGQRLMARVADTAKGMMAVELRDSL